MHPAAASTLPPIEVHISLYLPYLPVSPCISPVAASTLTSIEARFRPVISPTSPPYLRYISPTSPLHLPRRASGPSLPSTTAAPPATSARCRSYGPNPNPIILTLTRTLTPSPHQVLLRRYQPAERVEVKTHFDRVALALPLPLAVALTPSPSPDSNPTPNQVKTHFDRMAYVTAVASLNPSEFDGGLFLRSNPNPNRNPNPHPNPSPYPP